MSNFTHTHICAAYGGHFEARVDGESVKIRSDDTRIALTLTADQFAEVVTACTQAMEAARAEAVA